jgi:UDP-N-acetylmuramate dehydrogenase
MTMRIANPFAGLESVVAEHYPLKRHTWYRIGGPARYLVRPESVDQLREAVLRCAENEIPIYVLGLGANLLIRDEGIDGAVFRLDADAFSQVTVEGDLVTAGSGVDLQKLIVQTVRAGLAGIETLAGIPGTIGGAIRMNAGGKFGDLGAVVDAVQTMDLSGTVEDHARESIVFGYRTSDITDPFILGATLRLEQEDPDEIAKRCKEVWMYKRNSQPLNTRNSGCIFKNPGGTSLSAGALIDQAGLKGMKVGHAEVSDKHANFIIAQPDCPSDDVLRLIKLVQERVEAKHGVALEPEVKIWPVNAS